MARRSAAAPGRRELPLPPAPLPERERPQELPRATTPPDAMPPAAVALAPGRADRRPRSRRRSWRRSEPGSGPAGYASQSGQRRMTAMAQHKEHGFTLVELLVALFITAIMFAIGYGAIDQALTGRKNVETQASRLLAIQRTLRMFEQDIGLLHP